MGNFVSQRRRDWVYWGTAITLGVVVMVVGGVLGLTWVWGVGLVAWAAGVATALATAPPVD